MPARYRDFLALRNYREVRRIVAQLAPEADLAWYDQAPVAICTRWFRLAQQHLRLARELSNSPRSWRGTISRCYYAVYNSSKSVRYYVNGYVKLDSDDHKQVGDLPDDFPGRAEWSNFAIELRRDRNLADYEPWDDCRRLLSHGPGEALDRTVRFLRSCRDYLRARGVPL